MSRSRKRIFISYSHDSAEHRARVLQLANSLRQYGLVDVRLDQYNVDDPPEGWPLWMETELDCAQKVLLVCTETYQRRVKKQEDPGVGRGVCWEANLIYAELYLSQTKGNKFIPVIFRHEDREFIPRPLGAANSYLVDDAQGFERLYRHLTGQSYQPMPHPGEFVTLPLPEPLPLFTLPVPPLHAETNANSQLDRQDSPRVDPLLATPATVYVLRRFRPNEPPAARFELRELDWYDEPDAPYFRGREADVKTLRSLLLDQPVVRLFGPSGVGKSSLMRAGLLPALRKLAWRIAVVRPFDRPEIHIPRLIGEQLLTDDSPPLTPSLDLTTLQAELATAMSAENAPLLFLLVDQVEDVVSPFAPPEARERLVAFLRQVWNAGERARPQVRVLLTYRTDAESRLARLWQEISEDSSGLPYHAIHGLSQADAHRVISDAARQGGFPLPEHLDDIVAELEQESRSLDCSGEVFPPYLQIVLARLAQASESSGDGAASLTARLIHVKGLIGEYLHTQLERLEQRDGDFGKCRVILEGLSRSSGQKISLSVGEIAAEVRLSPVSVVPLLSELHQARLIRPVGTDTWEIQHDRLAEVIIAGMSDADRESKSARELLAAKAINHARTGEWLTRNELHLLYIHRARLTLSHRELYLLLGSILVSDSRLTRSPQSQRDRFLIDAPGWLIVIERSSRDIQLRLLREVAHDSDRSAQGAAIEAISRFQPTEALPLLRELARDDNSYIQTAAVKGIGRFLHTTDLSLIRELARANDSGLQHAAVNVIDQFNQAEDLPLMRELSNANEPGVRSAAIKVIGQFQQAEDRPLLRELAGDYNWSVRQAAVEAIGQFEQAGDLPLLRELVGDEDEDVRQAAVGAIGRCPQAEDLPLLRERATDPAEDDDVQRAALGAIIRFHLRDGIPRLRELALDDNWSIRQAAVNAIAEFRQGEDLLLLRKLVGDEDDDVRKAAVDAIGRYGSAEDLLLLRDRASDPDEDEDVREAAAEAIGSCKRDEALPQLRVMARDGNWSVRQAAVLAISKFEQIVDLPLLRELARDQDEDVRKAVAGAIAQFRQSEDVSLLRELARDEDYDVRQAAASAIGRYQHSETLPFLRDLTCDDRRLVREAAVGAISRFPKAEALPFLRELVNSKNGDVRQAAVAALCQTESLDELQSWFMNSLAGLSVDVVARLDHEFFAPDWSRMVVESREHNPRPADELF